MNTVSHKETPTLNVRCEDCKLWFAYLHEGTSGRDLCRMCLELAGENRARWDLQYGRR
jgi:hypothetical protein